jgi:tetratricopeptide (TPR) repeat protein
MESENLKTENGKWKMANGKWKIVPIALFAAYLSILISNFFGFSIVIINLYFFLIPAVFFTVTDLLPGKTVTIPFLSNHTAPKHTPSKNPTPSINIYQWILLIGITLFSGYLVLQLLQYWYADTAYALGNNLDKVGSYQEAYPKLVEAVTLEPDEPVYKDELAVNLATLASALLAQKDKQAATTATQFAQNAVALNNEVTTNHPNNVIFLKNRVRIFYSLAQSDPKNQQAYLTQALQAMQKANHIAPTDAKISYNLGILYGQTGNIEKAIDTLKQTIYLKPDYRDAYYALALFYHEQAIDKNGTVTNPAMAQKAEETMQYILTHISATDQQTKDTLNQWKK